MAKYILEISNGTDIYEVPLRNGNEFAIRVKRNKKSKQTSVKKSSNKPNPSITEIGLATRSANALQAAGIETVRDMSKLTWGGLIGIAGFGNKGASRAIEVLNELGYEIREDQ